MSNDPNVMRDAMLGRMNAALPVRMIDTRDLKPVRIEPTVQNERIAKARKTLRRIACDPECVRDLPHEDRESAWQLATTGNDRTLLLLADLLS